MSFDRSRFIDVWVADAIVADVAEIMEDERLWDLECLTWFPLRGGNGTGVRRTARRGSSQTIWPQLVQQEIPTRIVCSVTFLKCVGEEPGEAIERPTLDANEYRPSCGPQEDLLTPPLSSTPFYHNLP